MPKIFAVFGRKKSPKEGTLVEVYINDTKVSSSADGVQFISNPALRDRDAWWALDTEVDDGTILRIETKVGIPGKGPDTDRTTTSIFEVNTEYPIIEWGVPKVGYKRFPLAKGPFNVIESRSLQDQTHQTIEGVLHDFTNEE